MKKNILFVTAFNSNQKIRKKTKVDRRSFDRIDQKKMKWFYSSYISDDNRDDKKTVDESANYDELRRHQKFHFSTENEKAEHQRILRFNVEA